MPADQRKAKSDSSRSFAQSDAWAGNRIARRPLKGVRTSGKRSAKRNDREMLSGLQIEVIFLRL